MTFVAYRVIRPMTGSSKNRRGLYVVIASVLALSACGHSTGDRALSGAGIGAAVGAVGGLIVGAPVEGAVIGGAVGAGTGALTRPSQVDLGRPVWRDGDHRRDE